MVRKSTWNNGFPTAVKDSTETSLGSYMHITTNLDNYICPNIHVYTRGCLVKNMNETE